MTSPHDRATTHADYPAVLRRLAAGFDRRYPRQGDDEHRTAQAIVASIESHMQELAALSPPRDTLGALAALAWFGRCVWGREDRGGDYSPSFHPEDHEGMRRAFQRLTRAERRSVAAQIDGLDLRLVMRRGRSSVKRVVWWQSTAEKADASRALRRERRKLARLRASLSGDAEMVRSFGGRDRFDALFDELDANRRPKAAGA